MRFTIRNKLLFGFLSVAFFVTAANITAYYYNNKVTKSYDELIDQRVAVLSKAKDIQYLAVQQTNSLKTYLLTQDDDLLDELQTSNDQLHLLAEQAGSMTTQSAMKESFQKLDENNQAFLRTYERMIDNLKKDGDHAAALAYFKDVLLPEGQKLSAMSTSIANRQQQSLDQGERDNTTMVNFVDTMVVILSIIAFLMTLLIGLVLSQRITGNLFRITRVITGFTHDSKTSSALPHIEVRTEDEIGDIARSFNEMALTLNNYSILEQEQRWLETNISEMATKFQGVLNLEALARQFITTITPLVEASYGVLYVKKGTGRAQELSKLASYAYVDSGIGAASFKIGEGLVGQAALENRTIVLNSVPDNYIQITSGLGKAGPTNLLILPVQFEGNVVAVIELASFGPFRPIQQTLLQQIASHFGSVFVNIEGRMRVEQLLSESQVLTEELQTQSEELQTQSEELRGINEKLAEQYRNAEQKTRELEKTKNELEEKATQLGLSSQYKTEFLANMSHELRTPLNSLLILSTILAENADGNLNRNQVEYAHTIHQSGNDLLQLINDILDLSKIESGKIELVRGIVSLHDIGEFAAQQFLPVTRAKGLQLTTVLDPDLPPFIVTDEQRLLQIVKNLLSNAIKFTDSGEVKLHIHDARKGLLAEQGQAFGANAGIAFTISDTGIGIPSEQQGLIFQAFQQADGTTSRKYGGTGLGLSISLNMARLLNGTIRMSSKVGQGSVFSLVIPYEDSHGINGAAISYRESAAAFADLGLPAEQPTAEVIALDPAVWIGKKILIVDDDMRNIYATTIALESKKVAVLFAENGVACLKILKEHPDVDLILMDIMLPEMDGYETMRTLRQIPSFKSLPIIALTAKAMKEDREKCLEAGASDYMSKPVKLEQLFARIHTWLKG